MTKYILIFFGTVSLMMGITGIFIPVLPTTPFILLSAALYVQSSPALYQKIYTNKITGHYLSSFSEGINLRTRIFSIAIMWTMILLTSLLIINKPEIKILLVSLGIIGTIFKIRFMQTDKKNKLIKKFNDKIL